MTDLQWCSVSVYCRQAQHHFLHHSLRVVLQSCVSTSSEYCDVPLVCTASQHKAIFFTVISELFSSQVCLLVLWYTLNLSPPKVYGNFKQNTSTKIKKVVLKGDYLSWSVHISSYMEVPSINCNCFFLFLRGGNVLKLCLGTKNRV